MIRINNTQYFHFLQQADALRRAGSLCDAVISVKSHTFRAHRLVLACASGKLARQLAQGDAERPAHCSLELFSPRTFQQVLDFAYAQTLEVSADDLYLLLRAAQLLEMWPLEEQCRVQLDGLRRRAGEEEGEEEEEPRGEEEETLGGVMEEQSPGGSVQEEEEEEEVEEEEEEVVVVHVTTEGRASNGVITENCPRPDEDHRRSPPPRKMSRLSPLSSAPDSSRERKSSRPKNTTPSSPVSSSSSSSSSSPWTFSGNMWSSVSTLRRIAENYSNFFAAQASSNQSPVPYTFPLSAPHVFPFLSPHFQNQVMMSHSGFYPQRAQSIYPAASAGISSILRQGLLRRKRPSQRELSQAAHSVTEQCYPEVSKSSTESDTDAHQHKASQAGDLTQQDPASAPSGEVCAGFHFCGRDHVLQHVALPKQRGHRAEKPYQCQHCPKTFSLKHQLDTHHRVHTGEKPFECRLCGQRSRDYSAMIKHLRTHGGATPYQCTLCLEFCSSLVAMHRHVKSHDVQDFPPNWNISSTYLYASHI